MTLTELRSTAREVANVDSNRLPNTILTAYLNAAAAEVMSLHRLRFGEALITTAFIADTKTINPAASGRIITSPTAMWYANDQGETVQVRQIPWATYVQRWGTAATADGGSGDPIHFSILGEDDNGHPTFYLGPIPDDDCVVYVSARTRFEDLSADDDENQLTNAAPLLLVYRALEMAAGYLESSERVPEWQKVVTEHTKMLMIAHSAARRGAMTAYSMQEPG